MDKISQVLGIMEHLQLIPTDKGFEVTAELVSAYSDIYRELTPRTTKINKSTQRLNEKLSALNLLNNSVQKGYKPKAGIVYLIENPVFPDYYKVGITQNLKKRLSSYQTYDPLRRYKIAHYNFAFDNRELEKEILSNLKEFLFKGEWIPKEQRERFLQYLLNNSAVVI